jgi:hypothetical protein
VFCALILSLSLASPIKVEDQPKLGFRVSVEPKLLEGPFTGRVFVLVTQQKPSPLTRGLNWFNPQPGFAVDVTKWDGEKPITISDTAVSHPTKLEKLKAGKYWIQAYIDRDLGGKDFTHSPGNLYSKAIQGEIDPAKPELFDLKVDQVYSEPPFPESEEVKLFEKESALLSKFYGKPKTMRAGVILPPSFKTNPTRRYPIVYEITGFGGDHRAALGMAGRQPCNVAGVEMLWVVLDANCRNGHHVFADSANNGPVGTALVEELIPALEKQFRAIGQPGARFVTGHSSGGWSSLWLQVAYPDTFGGCWSTSPDPVDFRDFQRINLYAKGENMFRDRAGEKRPIARVGDKPTLWYQGFSDMEELMGRGGQLASFEGCFSSKGADGQPVKLWNRKTGDIDLSVAKSWEKYDIRLKLEREWPKTGSKLAGKIHVYMGDKDTFYLEGATVLLKEWVDANKIPAIVELFPGRTHGLVDSKLRLRMNAEMALQFLKWDMSQSKK